MRKREKETGSPRPELEEYTDKQQVKKSVKMADKAKKGILSAYKGMGQEARETREMARTFFTMLAQKLRLDEREEPPSKEEVKEAIDQLKDIGRLGVFSSISIIPGGAFSLVALEILARKFGVKNFTFIPSAFRKKQKNEARGNSEDGTPDD